MKRCHWCRRGWRGRARRDVLRWPLVDGSEGLTSAQPALWFIGSLLLRTSIALAGFYVVAGGQWDRLCCASWDLSWHASS